jgi:acetyl-CoA acetyltransferase
MLQPGPPPVASDPLTDFFWAGAREGRLLIQRCRRCGTYIHLPRPACRTCRSFDLAPEDMTCTAPAHCAQVYDGFSVIAFQWLEALGLCESGGAGPFVADGNTRRGGKLPVNTDGGAGNMGRRHAANFCIEATRQLRGQCGERQVPGAEVAVWTNAVGPFAGAMLLTAA